MKYLLLFFCLLNFNLMASAKDKHPLDTAMEACIDKDGSTVGMLDCHRTFLVKWDRELNHYYHLMGGDQNKALLQTQIKWIAFRDAEWTWIAKRYGQIYKDSGGGTLWGVLASADKLEVVRKRALLLREFYYFQHCDLTGDCEAPADLQP